MDTGDEGVVRRSNKPDEAEILDQDQQQQVIDSLKSQYESMIKSQRYAFIILVSIVSIVCFFAANSTGQYKIFIAAAISYISLIACDVLNQSWCWIITAGFELISLFVSYQNRYYIQRLALIAVHIGYLILVMFLVSSHHFSKSFPDEINRLQKLKYGSKLA
ncbi:hypothetical protein TRFO_24742 [Tritrichomonas foetus]|uniref:Transmembrane protein n=1 Tax=Tritrichomonas foetus TaxID=1144522 RepID=A0A1J4KBF2_9EUKA|nr:hypothetical protein TRFO_24742 [Tritrichomonas foetus]|eukprot:OHT07022.1 hypothetical protein TRFO_24742 [Tritrichomonas foetus]